ncbi:MAG: hypothetical protein WBA57_21695 [Elainellaceae cyanobacterium]
MGKDIAVLVKTSSKTMNIPQIKSQVKYITNSQGETTEVIIPVHLWENLLGLLNQPTHDLHPVDEEEPKERILADLKQALRDGAVGQTYPVSDLWNNDEA